MSWETEEKEKGWTRREWIRMGVAAAGVGAVAGLGGLVAGEILPPPLQIKGEVRPTIQYVKWPAPQWWNSKAGTAVSPRDFKEWQGALGVWNGVFQDNLYFPGTGYPCLIIRIKRENQFFTVPSADQIPDSFKRLQAKDPDFHLYFDDPAMDGGTRIVVLFDRCVHLCCNPGWHVIDNPPPGRDYSAYGASPPTYVQFQQDPIYCVCHGSQYDPMLLEANVHPSGAPYIGAKRVHGPAPRALAVIPVKLQGSTLVGGAPLLPDGKDDFSWYVYC